MEAPMQKQNDLNQSRIGLKQDSTLIAVIKMSFRSWLVAGIVPGVERQPLKKLAVDESALLKLLNRWREEAEKVGRRIERITVAFEAGRDGFWLARWLRARGIEAHVIHASSVAQSREHRRAKTDRLDTELLKRSFLGWLRGERDHCKLVAIPTIKDEDAKRPNSERESLFAEQRRIVNRMKAALIRLGIRGFNPKLKKASERLDGLRPPEGEPIPPNTLAELRRDMTRRQLVSDQLRQIEHARLERLKQAPDDGPHAMVRLLARVTEPYASVHTLAPGGFMIPNDFTNDKGKKFLGKLWIKFSSRSKMAETGDFCCASLSRSDGGKLCWAFKT